MSLADELRGALPERDANGDTFELVPRDRFFEELDGLIAPIRNRFRALERSGPPNTWRSIDEDLQGGARLIADLNTPEGRAAFLQCWWPEELDDVACVAVRAPLGREETVPYPTHTMLRTAVVLVRLAPDLFFTPMRFGRIPLTTTLLKANWDLGMRRFLFYPSTSFHQWLAEQDLLRRCDPVAPDDPLHAFTWTFAPGQPPTTKEPVYILRVPHRPSTDSYLDWMRAGLHMARSKHPETLWRDFCGAIGAAAAVGAYRANRQFPLESGLEIVQEFFLDGLLVGWGSLVRDPFTGSYETSIGVFPEFQGRGVRRQISRALCEAAFKDSRCPYVTSSVLISNPTHLARFLGEVAAGSPWQVSGWTLIPHPGQVSFILTRERYRGAQWAR